MLFSRAVASSRASICVTRWHCITVGQIHTVLDGCELHRTTCNSCKWCIFNHNMFRFPILLLYFAFLLIIKMLNTSMIKQFYPRAIYTTLRPRWETICYYCTENETLTLFSNTLSFTLISLTWAGAWWEHLNQLRPLTSQLALKGWPGFPPVSHNSVWYSLCQSHPLRLCVFLIMVIPRLFLVLP